MRDVANRYKKVISYFNTLAEFSRTHCIAICAFLVPANLVATSVTIIFATMRRPSLQVWQAAGVASFFALVMVLHVWTWLMEGVVMAPTYILFWLGSTCLLINLGAIIFQKRLAITWRRFLIAWKHYAKTSTISN